MEPKSLGSPLHPPGVLLHYNTMKIDLRSSAPIYQQIAEGIRAEIAVGVYRPGEGLPSIRSLAMKLKVNQNTVHKAYGELESEGLITQRRGLGMFVTNRAPTTAKTRARRSALAAFRRALSQCEAAGIIQDDVIPLVVDSLPASPGEEASK
jgi:GntR family transcriptional regulator